MNKQKIVVTLCGCVFFAGMALALAFRGAPGPVAFRYLGRAGAKNEFGRFSISNTTDRVISFQVIGVHFDPAQKSELEEGIDELTDALEPHGVKTVQFTPPAGAKRWRGWVRVSPEEKDATGIAARVELWWDQALKRLKSPKQYLAETKMDGEVVSTEEIVER